MTLIYTIAGVGMVIAGVVLLLKALHGKKSSSSVQDGTTSTGEAIKILGIAALIIIGSSILYQQVLATVGQGSQAGDPYIYTWMNDLAKAAMSGTLPQFK